MYVCVCVCACLSTFDVKFSAPFWAQCWIGFFILQLIHLRGLHNTKAILVDEQLRYYSTHNWGE